MHVVYRQGLYYIIHTVLRTEKLQHSFVDSAAYRKSEARVDTVTHIGKVLVRKQLK